MTGRKPSRLDEAHVTDPSSVMHVGCIKVERVGSEAVDDWHAHLVGQVDGAPSMPRAPYLAVTS